LPKSREAATLCGMIRVTAMLMALSLICSCTKTVTPEELRTQRGYTYFFTESYYIDVGVPFDDAWAATLAALQDLGWTVDMEVETSGLITTKETTIGTNRDRYACRQWPGSATRVDEMEAKLVIHAGSEDGTIIRITALADINGRYTYINSRGEEKVGGWLPCTSTGEMESELFDAVLLRLEPLKYVAPVYRKWTAK
jgi:hypothetical protein